MSGLPWFRLYCEFANDVKIQEMSETLQRRYIMLLCLKGSGELKQYTERELSIALRISSEKLKETKKIFVAKKFIDDNWEILNWEKRQYVSDSSNKRVDKFRRKKGVGTATIVTANDRYSNVTHPLQKQCSNGVVTPSDTDTEYRSKKAYVQDHGLEPEEGLREETEKTIGKPIVQKIIKEKRTVKTPVPEDFSVTEEHRQLAAELGVANPDAEAKHFIDHFLSKGERRANWNASFRNWLRNSNSFKKPQESRNANYQRPKSKSAMLDVLEEEAFAGTIFDKSLRNKNNIEAR
jgi:hypothetical protein